jgi:ABC-2 type transport system permease protein
MPGWMQPFAEHQPLTVMNNAVRALTQGPAAEALLGAPATVYIGRSLLWALATVAVFGALAIAQYQRR